MKKYSKQHVSYLEKKSKLGNINVTGFPQNKKTKKTGKQHTFPYLNLPAPQFFKLEYPHCIEVTNFIHRVKSASILNNRILIDLKQVKEICDGSIVMLLSLIIELTKNKVRIKGTFPDNPVSRQTLEKSGFFKYIHGLVQPENADSKNTIIRTGTYTTPPSEVSEQIYNSMETIWGNKGRNPPLRGGVYEMVRNSCDHAFPSESMDIFWHFSVTHNDELNAVSYSFVDNGKGIINTLHRKGILKQIQAYFKSNHDMLFSAFKDGIQSRTGLSWRGKGLPTIYELVTDNVVRNLIVISNDVFIDFENNIQEKLDPPFSGTYYHWIIDTNCQKYCFN